MLAAAWAAPQANAQWKKVPDLAGGTSAPITVSPGQLFTYDVYGWDKDTESGVQYFDNTLHFPHALVFSMTNEIMTLRGDDAQNGKRTWDVAGNAESPSGTTIYLDEWQFDDYWADEPGRDDATSSTYYKQVTVNVP
jgi:hypothetical protein